MLSELPKYITGLIIGVLLCLLFKGNQPNGGESTPTVTHTTDTLYLPSHVVYQTKVVPKLVYTRPGVIYLPRGQSIPDTVYKHTPKDSLIAFLAHREYQDTVTLTKGLRVAYKAQTRGYLDSLSMGVIDDRPTLMVIDSMRIVRTIQPKSHSLGIGAVVTSLGVAPGLQYTQGKVTVGLHYLVPTQPGLQGIQTSLHYTLGSW